MQQAIIWTNDDSAMYSCVTRLQSIKRYIDWACAIRFTAITHLPPPFTVNQFWLYLSTMYLNFMHIWGNLVHNDIAISSDNDRYSSLSVFNKPHCAFLCYSCIIYRCDGRPLLAIGEQSFLCIVRICIFSFGSILPMTWSIYLEAHRMYIAWALFIECLALFYKRVSKLIIKSFETPRHKIVF